MCLIDQLNPLLYAAGTVIILVDISPNSTVIVTNFVRTSLNSMASPIVSLWRVIRFCSSISARSLGQCHLSPESSGPISACWGTYERRDNQALEGLRLKGSCTEQNPPTKLTGVVDKMVVLISSLFLQDHNKDSCTYLSVYWSDTAPGWQCLLSMHLIVGL